LIIHKVSELKSPNLFRFRIGGIFGHYNEVDEDQGIREQLIDMLLDEMNFGSEDEDYDD